MRCAGVVSLVALAGMASSAPLAAEGYEYGNAGFGAWTIPVPLDLQAQQDLQPGQGMLVIGVRPGGTASMLGIQPGDVLTSLNNTPISSRHDIREVVLSVQPGDAAQAGVLTPAGDSEELSGTFQARPQRPPWMNLMAQGAGAASPPASDPAQAARWDPQTLINEQRAQLLLEQDALDGLQELMARLRSDLPGAGGPAGAWMLHFQLQGPLASAPDDSSASHRVMPGHDHVALATTASITTDAWSCSISCCTPAERTALTASASPSASP